MHSGRTIYEWEQTLEDVTLDVPLPPGATKKDLTVKITNGHLTVGLVGAPPYLDVSHRLSAPGTRHPHSETCA